MSGRMAGCICIWALAGWLCLEQQRRPPCRQRAKEALSPSTSPPCHSCAGKQWPHHKSPTTQVVRSKVHFEQLLTSIYAIAFHVLQRALWKQAKDRKKSGIFEAPTYRIKKRTGLNFITTFSLKTDESSSYWTMRGVALLCSID